MALEVCHYFLNKQSAFSQLVLHLPGRCYICKMPFQPDNILEIKMTPNRGRGVFCKQALPVDHLIEEAPVIVMPAADRHHLDMTLLHDYIFEWNADGEPGCCMALGYVPIYNHESPSNCEYVMDYEQQTMRVYTIRAIAAGEELTVNYNGNFDDERKVWFKKN